MAAPGQINIFALLIKHIKEEWVMWPLVVLLLVTFTITLERLIVIVIDRVKFNPTKGAAQFVRLMRKHKGDKFKAIEEMESSMQKKDNICADLMRTIMHKYKDGVQKGMNPLDLKKWMRDAMEEQGTLEMPALEAHLGWLAVISNVATLIGLFGTVYGMIQAFQAMSTSVGGVKADEMAGGISVALIATLFGLFVAIPSLLLFNYIKNMTEAHVIRIEDALQTMIEALIE